MIDNEHKNISISKQCQMLSISRSHYYYEPKMTNDENLKLMRLIDEQHLQTPFYGTRKMVYFLRRLGHKVSRGRVRRLMRLMNINVIYQKPRTSIPNLAHKIYPYLLRDLVVKKPNQVWATDITYIPMQRGFLYLVAVIDWFSRKVLAWKISNSMEVDFCLAALSEAIEIYGKPEIFNSDQGSQFTSNEFTNFLLESGIKISMDGKGRWVDNVFIERLWRSLKYECVYLQAFSDGRELRIALKEWMDFYNHIRPHASFNGQTPAEIYNKISPPPLLGYTTIREVTTKLAA